MTPLAHLDADRQRAHQWRNTAHTWLMIAGSTVLMAFIAWAFFGTSGVVWAAVFTGFGLWSASRVSPAMVLKLYKARPLGPREVPQLHQLMRDLATRAGLPAVPRIYYVPSKLLNAFAVGKPDNAAIAVTDGLIRSLTLRQLMGVIAHEVSHVRNGDLKVMALGDVLTRITGSMATMGLLLGLPAAFLTGGGAVPWIALGFLAAAPTIGSLLQLALSRTREYDADLDAAGLTGDPEGLASALQVLEDKQGAMWEQIMLPGARVPQPSVLRTHPRTADRIERLLSLRAGADADTAMLPTDRDGVITGHSIVPPIRNPRVYVSRLGTWY